jgi:hypothetical protein
VEAIRLLSKIKQSHFLFLAAFKAVTSQRGRVSAYRYTKSKVKNTEAK